MKRLLAVAAVVATGLTAGATAAQADLGFEPGGVIGQFSTTQAGAHPDFHTGFTIQRDGIGEPEGTAKAIDVDLPRGFLGTLKPSAIPLCDQSRVSQLDPSQGCPISTAVGEVTFTIRDSDYHYDIGPITTLLYNVPAYGNEPAAMAFNALVYNVRLDTSVRSDGDYGIRTSITNLTEAQPLVSTDIKLWGVPSDHQGDGGLLTSFGQPYGGPGTEARKPFLTNPSVCDGNPLVTTYSATPWRPTAIATATAESPAITGCDRQNFAPTIDVKPTTTDAGAPAGYQVDMDVPQNEAPDALATPPLKDATVTLPEGTSISPSAADGLDACSDDQIGLRSKAPEQCPDASKIGTVDLDTPLLDTPLSGSLYIGTQQSSDPQSGDMYRLFLVAEGSGVRIKLRGSIKADPITGQLTTSFLDNPQLPFSHLRLTFKGGNRAPLVNPTTCGVKTATATLGAWSGQSVDVKDSFTIDGSCPTGRFAPTFTAGTVNPLAGAYSPFTMTIARSDADQELSQIALRLPPGLLASLGSVPLCAEAQAAAGTCGADSQVGTTTVSAGPGSNPYTLPGKVFLAGPYKGAPFSLSIVVPAKAGPFDLGTVVVRSQLQVDAAHAVAAAPADPLPTILGGVPLKIRTVNIALDRPGFMFNATNCTASSIGATLTNISGGTTDVASRYQAQGCAGLKLDPKLDLKFTGKSEMQKNGHPNVTADLTQTFGQSGLKQVKVVLPLSVALAADNAEGLCTPAQAAARACPSSSIVGNASARTPALHDALSGPVYFVEGTRLTASGKTAKTLPKLWLKLEGEGVPLDLWADSEVVGPQGGQHLVTTFSSVPDAPISSFHLGINGGKHGILAATKDVCAADRKTPVTYDGQNGARVTNTISVGLPDCGLRVASATVSSTSIKAKLTGIGAGKISVSGKGVSRSVRTIKSATTATVTLKLTKATRSAVSHGKKVKVKLTATFTPKGSKKAQKTTKTVTVKTVKAKR